MKSGGNRLNMSDQWGLQQRKPTGCGVIPARASAAGTESLSHSAQCLPGHTWNVGLIFFPAMQKRGGQAGEGPEKGNKGNPKTGKLPCRERLGGLGLFSLQRGRVRGQLITMS